MKINIGIVDDHKLFVKSVSFMLESFGDYNVLVEALNGRDLQQKMLALKKELDIILVDVNMPLMDGIQTTEWLQHAYPSVKVVALSMKEDDKTIINMIKAGCCAYLMKDTDPEELEKALEEIHHKGYYNADAANINFRRLLLTSQQNGENKITEKEKKFLQYACTDMTYKQIAHIMNLSERTIDGYRESLFGKLNVQSRVGLAMEALRRGLVQL